MIYDIVIGKQYKSAVDRDFNSLCAVLTFSIFPNLVPSPGQEHFLII